VNRELAYPGYFAMIPTGPDPNAGLTEGFFAVAAAQSPRPTTVALVTADAEFARNPLKGARANAERYGFAIVHEQTYRLETTNFTPILDAVAATGCDLLFLCSYLGDKDVGVAHGRFNVELVELADFNLPLLDDAAHSAAQRYAHEHTRRWSASVAAADAYLFVTPEYCYFPPASLINAVQVVTREWAHKPAGVVSYGGISGGLRASQALRQLVTRVNVHPLPQVPPRNGVRSSPL
jgi:hypothetical protein